ncbi:MAG: CaiB/BaiF CoA transferase family protein [Alphaproteobacteria bacterium]
MAATETAPAPGPLANLRVVELGHIMAGPTCGAMLADLGADVIKLERLPDGDDTRRFLPPKIGGESAAYLTMNRNKRGVALDFRQEAGRMAARRLILASDILVENQRQGAMEKWGLGYAALAAENPRLIYCSISGFGRTGPYAARGGFDLIAQGMSGLMSITGEGPGRPPVKVGAPMTDITAGILAAMGVLAALHHRTNTGRGQLVDTSLYEAGIAHTVWQSAIAFATGVAPGPMGSAHPLSAPYQAFEAKDGWLTIGGANQKNWLRLAEMLGAPELAEDTRFLDGHSRMENRLALERALAPLFKRRTVGEWLAAFDEAGLPAGPIKDVRQMHDDPQTRAREMVVETRHPAIGMVNALGSPIKLSETPTSVRRAAPMLGQHTRAVLADIGYAVAEIDALLTSGAALDGAAERAFDPEGAAKAR